jgi:hypothetical protein
MALSRKERMAIKSQINDYMAKLDDSGLSRKDRMNYKTQINDLLAQLESAIDLQPEAAQQNQQLADLIAGKFNGEEPERFIKIIKAITDEIQAVSPVIQPTEKYIEIKKAVQP